MKHQSETDRFLDALEVRGLKLSQTQKKQLVVYYKLLLTWNRKINLVSRVETRKNLFHHFVASIVYKDGLTSLEPNSRIADLGTGGGFPGVVLAIMFPRYQFVLIDSSRKKTLFLKKVARETELDVEIINARVEDIVFAEPELMDLVVARGFASLSELLVYARPLLKKKGAVLSLKGLGFKSELKDFQTHISAIEEIPVENRWKEYSEKLNEKILLRVEY